MHALTTLDRRTVLKAMSLAPLMATLPDILRADAAKAGLISTDVCLLQPEVTEGPFYVDPKLIRADITEGRPGLPMALRLQVVTADCAPVIGARVDVWHCDASGSYSGVENMGGDDTTGQTFLRGTQMTDAAGIAAFQTIFPGWYPGRTTHIHYKVILADNTVLTSQIFFDEAVNMTIYDDHQAYDRQDQTRNSFNADDSIAQEAGTGAIAKVRMTEPDGAMEAALVVGISPDGQSSGLLDWLWRKG